LSRHLVEDRARELQPFVEQPAPAFVGSAQRRELLLQPARRHRRHDPPARQEVEARELLQRDQWIALRDDERRYAERDPLRPAREEPE
jgi:hypothetical protein